MPRLLLYAQTAPGVIELGHAVSFGVGDPVSEDGGLSPAGGLAGLGEHGLEAGAVEDIVAEHQTGVVAADELPADDERLRQSVRAWLHGITHPAAEMAAVAQESLEIRQILRGGYQQDVADSGMHERGERVIDHRLIVHRQELLAHRPGDGIEPRPAAAGQNYTFHTAKLAHFPHPRKHGKAEG